MLVKEALQLIHNTVNVSIGPSSKYEFGLIKYVNPEARTAEEQIQIVRGKEEYEMILNEEVDSLTAPTRNEIRILLKN